MGVPRLSKGATDCKLTAEADKILLKSIVLVVNTTGFKQSAREVRKNYESNYGRTGKAHVDRQPRYLSTNSMPSIRGTPEEDSHDE